MEPIRRELHEFIFRTDGYFKIPDFQRPYTWNGNQVDTFLEDIKKVVKSQKNHYFGTIVYVKENDHCVIIDGQQRLTTSLLYITALFHILEKDPAKSTNYDSRRLKEQYLVNTYNSNSHNRNKLTLRTVTTDNNIFEKIFYQHELDQNEKANKLYKAYLLFKYKLELEKNIDSFIEALKKFEIVAIAIDNKEDNPQLIFENINSTGEPLSAGDKIRNWALMLNNSEARELVYNNYWKIIENKLTRIENDKQVDYISDFFRTYLMCKYNTFVSDKETYPFFKKILNEKLKEEDLVSIKSFYDDIMKYLKPYLFIKFMDYNSTLSNFEESIFSIKFLKTENINTYIIQLFVDFIDVKLTENELENSIQLIESYLIRRILFGYDSKGLNKLFPELHKKVKDKKTDNSNKTYDDCLSVILIEMKGRTTSLPTDSEINNSIRTINFYNNKIYVQQFLLAKICDQSKESRILHSINDNKLKLTIEHIMPQKLTPKWQNDLINWELIHNKWLHTLPNLTLTAYNSELSNRPFSYKKTMPDGFENSPLLINKYISSFDIWDENSLEERAVWLFENIIKIWEYPNTSLKINKSQLSVAIYSPYEWVGSSEKRTKPVKLLINDQSTNVKDWFDLYKNILLFIRENHRSDFENLIDNNIDFGINNRPLITCNKDVPNKSRELVTNVFIESVLNSTSIINNIIKICEFVGYTEENCPIYFTIN